MSLLFNPLSLFVITFLPRSKCLLISRLQSSSAVIFEPKKWKSVTASTLSPSVCHKEMELNDIFTFFKILSCKLSFSLSYFTFIKRFFSSSSLSAIRVVSSVWLIFLLTVLISACNSPSLACHMMCSACKLSKRGDNIQPCSTPFSILNQTVVLCKVQPIYRFLRRQVKWSAIHISKSFPRFVIIHTVKDFSVVNEQK